MALNFDRSSLRLFGVDLASVPGYLRDGWAEALRWPALRWLTPDEPIRVLGAGGAEIDPCRRFGTDNDIVLGAALHRG